METAALSLQCTLLQERLNFGEGGGGTLVSKAQELKGA